MARDRPVRNMFGFPSLDEPVVVDFPGLSGCRVSAVSGLLQTARDSRRRSNPTDALLTRVFNMRHARDCPHPDNPATQVHVFEMGAGGPHAELPVAVQPDLSVAQQGAGGVHHVAFHIPDAN